MSDLRWWLAIVTNPHIDRNIWPYHTATLHTDESMSGCGAALNYYVPAAGFFSVSHAGAHINDLEITVALLALKHFVNYVRHRHVNDFSDSRVVVHYIANLTSRSPRLFAKFRTFRSLFEHHGVHSLSTCRAELLGRPSQSTPGQLPLGFNGRGSRMLARRFKLANPALVDSNELPSYLLSNYQPVAAPPFASSSMGAPTDSPPLRLVGGHLLARSTMV